MSYEKQPGQIEKPIDQKELDDIANEKLRQNGENLERRSPEQSSAERVEARNEALEQARSLEKQPSGPETPVSRPETSRNLPPNSKAARKEAFNSIMTEVQSQMSPADRAFSKFIHAPAVEAASDVAGKTIARPNAILAGSVTAFVTVLTVYLIARYYGYTLSGAESMLAFAAGWFLGIVFDFLRLMVTGRHN